MPKCDAVDGFINVGSSPQSKIGVTTFVNGIVVSGGNFKVTDAGAVTCVGITNTGSVSHTLGSGEDFAIEKNVAGDANNLFLYRRYNDLYSPLLFLRSSRGVDVSAVVNDQVGRMIFQFLNDAVTKEWISSAMISSIVTDITDGIEDGEVYVEVMKAGTLTETFRLHDDLSAEFKGRRYGPLITFADGDTSPDVLGGNVFKTANTVATSITTFDSEIAGHNITIIIGDTNTTFVHGAGVMLLSGTINWTPAPGDTITLVSDGTVWYEVGRSDNTV